MPETSTDALPALQSSPVLQGERVAFTGTLASMTHRQAMDLVEQHGGLAMQFVGQLTSLLVVGEEGWPLEPDGLPSIKLEHARQLHDKGQPIQIVSESEWLKLLNVEPPERRSHQLYTPAMLCQLLKVSVHEIRRWERAGLIKPIKKIYRLPYFNFDEVASARRLCELAASGVKVDQIAASLDRLHTLLPNVVRPIAQLEVMARGSYGLAFRDESGLIETTGQRLFDFDPPQSADSQNVVDSGVADQGSISPLAFASESTPPNSPEQVLSSHFNVLRDSTSEFHEGPATIPIRPPRSPDHQQWTSDDWFQEGCRRMETNEITEAVEALRLAVIGDPLNPTLQFHLADALYRQRKTEASIERYHVAVELDHNFIEAWTQLGCVLSETGDQQGAKSAFQIALDVHPDYPDAYFHLAGVLEQLGEKDEAADNWRKYLEFDQRGPWAEIAREHLLGKIE